MPDSTVGQLGDSPAAQALLHYMEWWSEDRYCAGWLFDLETTMAASDDVSFRRLVEQAGGWWHWSDAADDTVFRPGAWNELPQPKAHA